MTAYAVIRTSVRRRTGAKIEVSPEDACAQAEIFVLGAGFVLAHVSNLSEARYFLFPKRFGVLRIAMHPKRGRGAGLPNGPTLASVTFNANSSHDGLLRVTPIYIEWQTATAIGLYTMRAKFV